MHNIITLYDIYHGKVRGGFSYNGRTHEHVRMHVLTSAYPNSRTHTHTHTHTHTQTHTNTDTHTHTRTHASTRPYTHTHTHCPCEQHSNLHLVIVKQRDIAVSSSQSLPIQCTLHLPELALTGAQEDHAGAREVGPLREPHTDRQLEEVISPEERYLYV